MRTCLLSLCFAASPKGNNLAALTTCDTKPVLRIIKASPDKLGMSVGHSTPEVMVIRNSLANSLESDIGHTS